MHGTAFAPPRVNKARRISGTPVTFVLVEIAMSSPVFQPYPRYSNLTGRIADPPFRNRDWGLMNARKGRKLRG
jgi:hypothetical protein